MYLFPAGGELRVGLAQHGSRDEQAEPAGEEPREGDPVLAREALRRGHRREFCRLPRRRPRGNQGLPI